MTSQNLTGNGSRLSLENCLTNIFALTDLSGIRWKRLRSQPGSSMEVLDDPVLHSYSKCLKADMLCSWARVPITDGSAPPTNFMGYAKELWVFWYGDEPTSLQTCLSNDLQEFDSGTWETTLLSYECRTFLFKALHNVIERCLLAKHFVRIGKWFVKPSSDSGSDLCSPLSFSFQNFFLHGDSTVCVSVDVERRSPVYRLTSHQLRQAMTVTTGPPGVTATARNVNSVILAPYGLSGVLTGRVISPADKTISDWQQFYPLNPVAGTDPDLPVMVEVAVGGVRMKYPSAFVVTTHPPKADDRKAKLASSLQCERCLSGLVNRTANDGIQTFLKRDDDTFNWLFTDTTVRNHCNCGKNKISKQKIQKVNSPMSPKIDNKRIRTFHRRSPPIEKLVTGNQPLLPAPAADSTSLAADGVLSAATPQANVKEALTSPASLAQPSPLRTPGSTLPADKHSSGSRPSSVRPVPSVEDVNKSAPQIQQPASVKSQPTPTSQLIQVNTNHSDENMQNGVNSSLTTYQGTQIDSIVKQQASPFKDPTKRPCLPRGPQSDDELYTESLYQYSNLNNWLDLPLKKFKGQQVTENKPKGYEELSHPLSSASISHESVMCKPSALETTTIKTEAPSRSLSKTEMLTEPGSLMTNDSLKPDMSDLDKMFDSEDEEDKTGSNSAASYAMLNGLASSSQHSVVPSGGMSMASAHVVGPISATDLSQIYPTPPSHDNHHPPISPVDYTHHMTGQETHTHNDVDLTEHTTSIYRTANIAKYVTVDEYEPISLPSSQQMINIPTECQYNPLNSSKNQNMPLSAVENLPSTLAMHQPSSVQSIRSPPFYPPGRTPLGGPLDILQSPASVTSLPPKSCAGLLSVENPSTHGAASTFNAQALPEAQSLLVNMTLSDSMLNLYKDQNFESCNLCVCNMNILGNDSGLYLPREKYEAQYKCSCGFSAVVNRKYGLCSGLFYQDECDIMNHRDDRFDKLKLSPLTEKSPQEVNRVILHHVSEQFGSWCMSLLMRQTAFSENVVSSHDKKSLIEQHDMSAVITSALNTGQYIQDSITLSRQLSQSQCLSKWPLEKTSREKLSSNETIQLLRSLQPALQDAVQKKRTTSLWDPNAIKVSGPLTWQAFFKQAGRNDGLLEPQPIPPFIVGSEDDWMRQSPFAIQHWDKLQLKPFGGERNVSYIIVAPDNDLVLKASRRFFQELSQHYEQCHLGKHVPYQGFQDGILKVGRQLVAAVSDKSTNDWFKKIDPMPFAEKMKLIAKICKYILAPKLSQKAPDISSPPPPPSHASQDNVFTKPNQPTNTNIFSPPPRDENSSQDILTDPRYKDARPRSRDNTHTSNVIYLINPFSTGSTSSSAREEDSASTLALIMCYQELLDSLPEPMRGQTYLQIVPLQALLSSCSTSPDQQVLKSMSFSIYSRIVKKCTYQSLGHTMTGFGPVADSESLKNDESATSYMSIPPYMLAPCNDHLNQDNLKMDDKSRVLFCAYCLSEDQRWLLASVIRDNGEVMETTVINIHVPNHSRRKKATVIKHGIQKLFEFLLITMSKGLNRWRLVIGRFGRLGHGELEEWSKLLSKKSLQRACSRIKEHCNMCSAPSLATDRQLTILGACLTSIEPHASFSILYNDVNSREDKKSNSSPLNTPQDASVTHILVIPNSTTAGGNHSQNEAQIDFSTDMQADSDNLLGNFDLEEDLDIGDIFGMVNTTGFDALAGSPPHSPRASPTSNSLFAQPGGIGSRRGTVTSVMDAPEDLVNQQPLAMGFLVSTAPTGKLPAWFYSSAPHTENACPAVLKSALHFRTVCSQQHQDDYNQMGPNTQKSNTHPLDSSQTCDVLRFVLDSYNRLSWLTLDPVTNDRRSCLPVHIDVLMKLYHAINSFI